MDYEMWIVEASNGSVQFDTEPSNSDISNACEDLEYPREVYALTLKEVSREWLDTIHEQH